MHNLIRKYLTEERVELVETHVKKKAFLNVLCQHKELYELTEDRSPKGGRQRPLCT